ncbi:MAG: RrF2 family transcriptional regulator [Isosphaeraceae bacterium]
MIPMTAEYALRAVVIMARDAGKPRSADEIALVTRVPRRYVNKVLQALVRARLVRSQSGPGGGYALLRPPEEVSILEVVTAVEPMPRIRTCPLGLEGHTSLCPLHQKLDEACAATERAFASVTIAHLLSQSGSAPPLCKTSKRKTAPRRLKPE